jgi:anti-sigma factor RsiW
MDRSFDADLVTAHIEDGYDVVGYADGSAPVEDQRRLEAHFESCRDCLAAVEELRATVLLLTGSHEVTDAG